MTIVLATQTTTSRIGALAVILVAWVLLTGRIQSQAQPAAGLTVLTQEGRRPLPSSTTGGRQMVALSDLTSVVPFSVREDVAAGGLSIVVDETTIVLSLSQGLASVGARVVSLPTAPVRSGASWLVPVEFIGRVLAVASKTPIDHHVSSGLVVVGALRVPRVVVRYDGSRSVPTLTFGITPRATPTVVQDAGRLLVQFDVTAIDADIAAPPSGDVLRGVSVAEGGRAVAVDLGPRFGSYRAEDASVGDTSQRLTLELVPAADAPVTGAGAPAPSTSTGIAGGAPGTPATPGTLGAVSSPLDSPVDLSGLISSTPSLRTIVIDPGHGGEETGAKGPGGALEKDVALSVARRLKSMLEGRLGLRVLMTRDADIAVPLEQRASMANNNKADLFVSIHANASVRSVASGAEVFFLSLGEYQRDQAAAPNTAQHMLPLFGGGSRDVELILWETAQSRHITESSYLAQMLEDELRKRVTMSGRAIQQAPFRVLIGANMPAVLVETGFITNPDEEKLLTSSGHQNELAEALFESIVRFRAYREGGAGADPVAPHQEQ